MKIKNKIITPLPLLSIIANLALIGYLVIKRPKPIVEDLGNGYFFESEQNHDPRFKDRDVTNKTLYKVISGKKYIVCKIQLESNKVVSIMPTPLASGCCLKPSGEFQTQKTWLSMDFIIDEDGKILFCNRFHPEVQIEMKVFEEILNSLLTNTGHAAHSCIITIEQAAPFESVHNAISLLIKKNVSFGIGFKPYRIEIDMGELEGPPPEEEPGTETEYPILKEYPTEEVKE